MTPPEQLRRAALLLEQAKASINLEEIETKLTEARRLCARATQEIDSVLGLSMEQIGRLVERGARWF